MRDIADYYDDLAGVYDARYVDATALFENDVATRLVQDLLVGLGKGSKVLDVGCGTGLALDQKMITIDQFVGMDPSVGMLHQLIAKHPGALGNAFECTFEEFLDLDAADQDFDAVISLFGSPSYVQADFIETLFEMSPRVITMHYRECYWPDFEPEPPTLAASRETAAKMAEKLDGRVFRFNNMQVCVVDRA